jgi:hypothetical protein
MANPDFPSAATRHLRDADHLLATSPGNARYLAGYIAECALKAVIERSDPLLHAPAFGHQLTKLEGDGFDLAIALAPRTARYRPRATTVHALRARWSETVRYDSTSDTKVAAATQVVELAREIYEACVIAMRCCSMECLPRRRHEWTDLVRQRP